MAEPTHLSALFENRARAELEAADALAPGSDAIAWRGSTSARVMMVKGLTDTVDSAAGRCMAGADGEAIDKALAALGVDPADTFVTCSRPEPSIGTNLRQARLRMQIEAVAPRIVVALDPEAAEDVSVALGHPALPWGKPIRIAGRTVLAVQGFSAALDDPERKRRVWGQLKSLQDALEWKPL